MLSGKASPHTTHTHIYRENRQKDSDLSSFKNIARHPTQSEITQTI